MVDNYTRVMYFVPSYGVNRLPVTCESPNMPSMYTYIHRNIKIINIKIINSKK